jgi:hypothetical protein
VSGLFQRADAPQAGGFREVHGVRELHIGHAPVLLQGGEYGAVKSVEGHGRFRHFQWCCRQNLPEIPENVTYFAI